jgi:hypothetical protein
VKHLVLIAGVYYPNPSPTGKCAMQYIELLKENYEIDVIYMQADLKKIYGEVVDGVKLYGLSNWRLLIETWFQEQYKKTANKLLRRLFTTGILIMKAIGRIQSMVLFPNNLRWFYKKAFNTLQDINNVKSIDVVFTVNSPFSAHIAGMKYKLKFPQTKWITYTVDPFSSSDINKRLFIFPKLKAQMDFVVEKNIYNLADFNYVSEEVYKTDINVYKEALSKTEPLPYMLTKILAGQQEYFSKDKINLLFAGRFYKIIRNPEYLLKIILALQNKNIVLHLYSVSDCEGIINEYVSNSEGRIIIHKQVGMEKIRKIMIKADFLINVGNSIAEFKPSKTFEYISARKPIINFYQHGLSDDVLDKYPLALQIDQNKTDIFKGARLVEKFIIENYGKNLPWSEIEELYGKHLSKNIKKRLIEEVGL